MGSKKASVTKNIPFQDILISGFPKVHKNLFIVFILLITFISFIPALQNGFVRWDDHEYITNNEIIKSLANGERGQFGKNVSGNFHPLTMFSLSVDYLMFKLNPFYYHLKNIVFHLLNTLLVFYLIMQVSKKNFFVSLLTALLFGIHPMHVESVAWVSERKDVLYSFYFLLGLILYYRNTKTKNRYYLYLSFGAFILSCLAKSAAVVFPLVLILIDYVEDKKISRKKLLEKIPFLIVSLIFGLIALWTQSEAGAVNLEKQTFVQTILFSSFGFFNYILKFIYPFRLAHTHPFPEVSQILLNGVLFLNLAMVYLVFRFRNRINWLFWSFGFFIISIILVLQIIHVGSSFISDRYTYLPYIGLGLIYAMVFETIYRKYPSFKPIICILLFVHISFLGYKTFTQTRVWKDTVTLWTNYNEVYPEHKSRGYMNLAEYYSFQGDSLKAFRLIDTAILIDPENYRAHGIKGNFYFSQKKYELSKSFLDKALDLNHEYLNAYKPRSLIYYYQGLFEEALEDINFFISKTEKDFEAYNLRGTIYIKLNKLDSALLDFNKSLALEKKFTEAFNNKKLVEGLIISSINPTGTDNIDGIQALLNRGYSKLNSKNFEGALNDFNQVLVLRRENSEAIRGRSLALFDLKRYNEALIDINKYLEINSVDSDILNKRILCYISMNQFHNTIPDFERLIQIQPENGNNYQGRALSYMKLNEREKALKDLLKAQSLGVEINPVILESLKN